MFETFHKMVLLTVECQQVIALRLAKLARGGAAASDEAMMMWSEKADAAVQHGPALLAGGSLDTVIDGYRTIVEANRMRLEAVI